MIGEEAYHAWAPPAAPWSDWVKPVLFTSAVLGPPAQAVSLPLQWLDAVDRTTAVVLDLPGEWSVPAAIELAHRGFQPVPLFNGCSGGNALLDVTPICMHLCVAASLLREVQFTPDAPPAFLLDANRMRPRLSPSPGRFDNRWVTLPQDFPSASLVLSRGLQRVLLVQADSLRPQDDLAHVLRRWQLAGLVIHATTLAGPAQPIDVPQPSYFRRAWWALIATLGLRRNNVGGFGAMIPIPSQG